MTSNAPVVPDRENALDSLFHVTKPIIGMVHVLPMPGAPRYQGQPMKEIVARAVSDSIACIEGGMDGLIVENEGDIPFQHPDDIGMETVAGITAVAAAVQKAVSVPLGVNILANGVRQSLAVAKAVDARFVRSNQWVNAYVANEGVIEGAAAKALRYRSFLRAQEIRIFADVHVKHGSHAIVADRSLAEQTHDVEFFDADVLIATGQRTSDPTPFEELNGVKTAASLPVIIGSGLTVENARELMSIADGAIVGSSVKEEGVWWNPVSVDRVRAIMREVMAVRPPTSAEGAKRHEP